MDTNILLRLLVNDDPQQSEKVRRHLQMVMQAEEIFVPLIVVAETCWVLGKTYGYGNPEILKSFRVLTEMDKFVFQHAVIVTGFFQLDDVKGDIPDHLIALINFEAGCRHTVTFDKAAARAIAGMELLS